MSALTNLQNLFRDLFQLELADLDFGIYRLLRLKREEIEAFVSKQLPSHVEKAFQSYASQERTALEGEISILSERVRKEISDDALLANGDVSPQYRDIKAKAAQELLQRYQAAREKLKSVQASEAQMAEVFNHLYSFFARYYDSGDFIPRRRYGAFETYAVPYRGEEVFFHWANKDQHYVKTAENFRDYAFTVETLSGPSRVRFLLTEASVPPGNLKGDTRYFFPVSEDAAWDTESRTFRIPFHYRLPSEKEVERYGKNSKFQEGVLQDILPRILKKVPDVNVHAVLAAAVDQKDGRDISLLLKRLRHFCRRNTADYFIHKNLEGFLKRELEFYIKDQMLHLGDLDGDLESRRRTLRVFRELAEEVITFLAQIENVQKRLFEKRKFVLRTDYLVPIKEVPPELWKEVFSNKEQLKAWKDLFAIEASKKAGKEEFLKQHPTLVVHTVYFPPEFKDKLLASFPDLDEATDGLLVHAENYQALQLLERKYAGKIKCVYIDPPYNTGNDEFVYKDRYRHSSWLAMMEERLRMSSRLLHSEGLFMTSCDEHELDRLRVCLVNEGLFNGFVTTLVWKARNFTDTRSTIGISLDHEYILASGATAKARFKGQQKDISKYANPDRDRRGPWTSCSLLGKATAQQRPNLHYEFKNPETGETYRCPSQTGWICSKSTMLSYIEEKRILWPKKPGGRPRLKVFLEELKSEFMGFPSIIDDVFTSDGTVELRNLFGAQVYPFPKPSDLVRSLVGQSGHEETLVMDFFAGSGTTGHAVLNLNREDTGRRKFILVEMADYFDTVLLPRIQKVIYAPEWKDGKPSRLSTKEEVARSPCLVKVVRLEGYDDALHNLATEKSFNGEKSRAKAHKKLLGEDAYRLHYLVRLPLESSAVMLDVEALERPFDYKIEVLTEDGPRVEPVDLVETFNFLYGLHVSRVETWSNGKDKRVYKAVKGKKNNGESALVLWRDMTDLDPVVERDFLETRLKSDGPFDEVLINGDSATPGLKSLDGIFKRLFEEEER
jgi:adenine-specific DNA-methyltransferase